MSKSEATHNPATDNDASASASLRFLDLLNNDDLLNNGFGSYALPYAAPAFKNCMNYGEGFKPSRNDEQFGTSSPTIELALDDLLFNEEQSNDNSPNSEWSANDVSDDRPSDEKDVDSLSPAPSCSTARRAPVFKNIPPLSQADYDILQGSAGSTIRKSVPSGIKAECSNCGTIQTPLWWRRGLNNELNCNACRKLHTRPRPNSLYNSYRARGGAVIQALKESGDVMAQCYNCHATTSPIWRKDDEGKTVCNVCALYFKLCGSTRPLSPKYDDIRKCSRSRHDTRLSGPGPVENDKVKLKDFVEFEMFPNASNFTMNKPEIVSASGNVTINHNYHSPLAESYVTLLTDKVEKIFNACEKMINVCIDRWPCLTLQLTKHDVPPEIPLPSLWPNAQVIQTKISMCMPGFPAKILSSIRLAFF